MLYLTCTMITSVDLAHYGVSRAKDWVSVDYGTNLDILSYIETWSFGFYFSALIAIGAVLLGVGLFLLALSLFLCCHAYCVWYVKDAETQTMVSICFKPRRRKASSSSLYCLYTHHFRQTRWRSESNLHIMFHKRYITFPLREVSPRNLAWETRE